MRMSKELQHLASAAVAGLIATLILFHHVNLEQPLRGDSLGQEVTRADAISPLMALDKGLREGVNFRQLLPPKPAEPRPGGH